VGWLARSSKFFMPTVSINWTNHGSDCPDAFVEDAIGAELMNREKGVRTCRGNQASKIKVLGVSVKEVREEENAWAPPDRAENASAPNAEQPRRTRGVFPVRKSNALTAEAP
jgi:hypothetical protein